MIRFSGHMVYFSGPFAWLEALAFGLGILLLTTAPFVIGLFYLRKRWPNLTPRRPRTFRRVLRDALLGAGVFAIFEVWLYHTGDLPNPKFVPIAVATMFLGPFMTGLIALQKQRRQRS